MAETCILSFQNEELALLISRGLMPMVSICYELQEVKRAYRCPEACGSWLLLF